MGVSREKVLILCTVKYPDLWNSQSGTADYNLQELSNVAGQQMIQEIINLDYPIVGIGIYGNYLYCKNNFVYLKIPKKPKCKQNQISFKFEKIGVSQKTSEDLYGELHKKGLWLDKRNPGTICNFGILLVDNKIMQQILNNLGEEPPEQWKNFYQTNQPQNTAFQEFINQVKLLEDKKFNLFYDITILKKFYYSINSGNKFVILSGPTGTGKTLLGMIYAYIKSQNQAAFQARNLPDFLKLVNDSKNENELKEGLMKNLYLCFVRVQPNWVSPKDIIGYYNPFSNRFIEGQIFYLLYYASKDKDNNYFLILDEMNLSHPEWYLSDIISAMETGGEIYIHDKIIPYPKNLFIIGTINLDETTKELSPRLKSRAFYIEMRANFDNYISKCNNNKEKEIAQILKVIDENLKTIGLGLGYRDIKHIKEYVENGGEISDALIAKIIPRIRTTDEEIKNVVDKIIKDLDSNNLGLKEFKNEDFEEFKKELENLKQKFEKYGYI
jgi:hypothetical protein